MMGCDRVAQLFVLTVGCLQTPYGHIFQYMLLEKYIDIHIAGYTFEDK